MQHHLLQSDQIVTKVPLQLEQVVAHLLQNVNTGKPHLKYI